MNIDSALLEEELPKKKRGRPSAVGIKYKQSPISVKLPDWLQQVLREKVPNCSEYVRDAIAEKMKRDGLLGSDQEIKI